MIQNNSLGNEKLLKMTKTHKFCVTVSQVFMVIFVIPVALFIFALLLTFVKPGMIGFDVFLGVISIFALIALSANIKRITQRTTVTNTRVIISSGWINKTTTEIIPEKIESITIKQGLFGKLYGFGNVYIHGLGGTKDEILFTSEPFELKQVIQELVQTKLNNK